MPSKKARYDEALNPKSTTGSAYDHVVINARTRLNGVYADRRLVGAQGHVPEDKWRAPLGSTYQNRSRDTDGHG